VPGESPSLAADVANMEPIGIRPALKADLLRIAGLDHSSSTDHVWQLELRRDARGPQISATFREVRLPRPVRLEYPNDSAALSEDWKRKAMLWVATIGTEPVGYLAVTEPRAGTAWITDVVVAPIWRRKGVGSALLDQARQWAVERGTRMLFFEMQSKNYPAIMLAQNQGYEFCGYNDHYYSNQDIALIFVRGV
jgi:ribosomal protein S18 acetylase RimI-like enzyme